MLKIGFSKPSLSLIAICVLTLFGATAATARDASEIFKVLCALCHGKEGEGKRVLGPALKGNEFIAKGTDAEIKATIRDGRSGVAKKYKDFAGPMPAQKALDDAELDALVKYLKDLHLTPEQRQEERAKKYIGKTFWVSQGQNDFKQTPDMSQSDYITVSQPTISFTLLELISSPISEYKGKILKLQYDNGDIGFISVASFDRFLPIHTGKVDQSCDIENKENLIFETNPLLNKETCQQEITIKKAQEEKAKEEKEFVFKDWIGKEFTFTVLTGLKPFKELEHYYDSLTDFRIKKLPLKRPFTVTGVISNGFSQYYKVKFASGEEGYIASYQLAHGFKLREYICKSCDDVMLQSDDFLAFTRITCNNIAIEKGFTRGKSLWLKYEAFDLPWLKKIKVKDYKPDDDGTPPITMLIEVDGEEKEVSFYWPQFNDFFYVSDPAPRIAKWGKRVLTAIKENKVFIGMSKEQVRASWGVPDDINRTVGPWGIHEQWIYGNNGTYLYFENDKLTSWQD